jgi:hypothetical protein
MEDKASIWKTGMNIGLITGLVMIVYSLILYIAGLPTNQTLGYFSFIILLGGIVWSHQQYKRNGDGYLSYGEGLGLGTVVSGFAGILSSIFSFIYMTYIDSGIREEIKNQQIIALEQQGLSDEQIEQAMGWMEKMMTPGAMLFTGIFSLIFFGFLFSLIISIFTKKQNPSVEI